MNWTDEVKHFVRKAELLEIDMRRALERELGPAAARSLSYDGSRATWRYDGRTYTALTLVQLVDRAGKLRIGVRPKQTVQLGFELPMARGGSR